MSPMVFMCCSYDAVRLEEMSSCVFVVQNMAECLRQQRKNGFAMKRMIQSINLS